jgi:hypothetical protein
MPVATWHSPLATALGWPAATRLQVFLIAGIIAAILAGRLLIAFEGTSGNAHDITERTVLEEQLRHQTSHDPLTGLANRALFSDQPPARADRGAARLARHLRIGQACKVWVATRDAIAETTPCH